MRWPLPDFPDIEVPEAGHPGSFGAVRKHDIHTGVDLYCERNAQVVAIEAGEVIKVELFTGPNADSPWWNETWAVWVYNWEADRTIVYGEVRPLVVTPEIVQPGDPIGVVETVLKKDKGLPMNMLHFELYEAVPEETAWWHHGQPKPTLLQDPTTLLKEIRGV